MIALKKIVVGSLPVLITIVMSGIFFLLKKDASSVDLRHLQLEIADTPQTREHGLSGREALRDTQGMLFIFDRQGVYPFWMNGMKFPLDILWLRSGQVVDIATLNPPQGPNDPPAMHVPLVGADRVLELNAGLAEKWGIRKGVRVRLSR